MSCPYNQARSQLPFISMCIVLSGSCSLFVKDHTENTLGKDSDLWVDRSREGSKSKCVRHKYPCWWWRGRSSDTVCKDLTQGGRERWCQPYPNGNSESSAFCRGWKPLFVTTHQRIVLFFPLTHKKRLLCFLQPIYLLSMPGLGLTGQTGWRKKNKQKNSQKKQQTKKKLPRKTSITHFFGTLRPSLVEAEPYDAEIFAVEDELCWVELQFLVWTQYFPFPLCIIYWGKTNANYD